MHVMATILITKFTKEKVLYTQKVLSTSGQFCVAAETKTRCHFLFVASPSLRLEKETMRDKSPKKLGCPCLTVCCQTAGLSSGCQYSAGFGLAPLRVASGSVVSAPPPYLCISYATAVPWILLQSSGASHGRNTSLCFVHLHISVLARNDCLMVQPGAELLVVVVTPRGCRGRAVEKACFGNSK